MISTTLLSIALYEAGKKIVEAGIVDPALEKGMEPLSKWLTGRFDRKKAEEQLQSAFIDAIKKTQISTENKDDLSDWLKVVGLLKLQAENNHNLRMLVSQTIIGFHGQNATPPEELLTALRWPRSRKTELSKLLSNIRSNLSKLSEWQPLISYADGVAERGLLEKLLAKLSEWNSLMVWASNGNALRVVVEKMHLSQSEAAMIEKRYRADLAKALYWHNFRGIVQVKQDLRLPLGNIYLELSILELQGKEQHDSIQTKMLELNQDGRFLLEESRVTQHISDILQKEKKLVLLGDPGSGKTITLRYLALMLANIGGAINLGIDEPLIPLVIRLADYARELEKRPALSLENYLIEYIQQANSGSDRLGEFLHLSLEQGKCMLLLDGLDEVATNPRDGRVSHASVVSAVQNLADLRCNDEAGNHIIVTSRIEGYWTDPLRGYKHVQLSPLRIPDEVESFLTQWYAAHEQAHDRSISFEQAESRAHKRIDELLPRMLQTPSVRRLATNPLLLTILALINENLGRLPNRRIKLYEIAAQTLIESWRQFQVGLPDSLIAELGEEMIIRIMAPLAYWMHETHPGGTASYEEWRTQLQQILIKEGFEKEAEDLTNRFLYHARFQTGLLTERSLDQYGFFHLTFEEYLTARQIARQREDERRKMLKSHWSDPRWQEVILLTAGQLGIAESKTDDVSAFITDLMDMEPDNIEQNGRPAILAGRALADIGSRSVTPQTRRWVYQGLLNTARDADLEAFKPSEKPQTKIPTRVLAADILDELGYMPDDLFSFISIDNFLISKYPVTNIQYQRFIEANDYMDPELWKKFPMFDENCQQMTENWGNSGIEWLTNFVPNLVEDGSNRLLPKNWKDVRFGALRKNIPVVGVSWYEANAYCMWLKRHWDELPEGGNGQSDPKIIRLPTSSEWELSAGGTTPRERYAWNKSIEISHNAEEILHRANVRENKLGFTTQVWLYPAGETANGIMDMTGNVWEWQANFSHKEHNYISLRGGSWNVTKELAYVGYQFYFHAFDRSSSIGFRLLIPKDHT